VLINNFLIAGLSEILAVFGGFFLAREGILLTSKIIFAGIEPGMFGTATAHSSKKNKKEKITQTNGYGAFA
jgi:hypothetical protein